MNVRADEPKPAAWMGPGRDRAALSRQLRHGPLSAAGRAAPSRGGNGWSSGRRARDHCDDPGRQGHGGACGRARAARRRLQHPDRRERRRSPGRACHRSRRRRGRAHLRGEAIVGALGIGTRSERAFTDAEMQDLIAEGRQLP